MPRENGSRSTPRRPVSAALLRIIDCNLITVRKDVVVFHAGTSKSGDGVITSGGRVLVISAFAPTLQEALSAAYSAIDGIHFEGKTYRRDIGHRLAKPSYMTIRISAYMS
jgi:phosphoribosylamine-glycine ligase